MNLQKEKNPSQKDLSGKYLTFKLNHESYGLNVLQVREIITMQTITPIPQMPSYIKGVINLRGKIIPIIDMRLKFHLEKAETTDATCIIVVQLGSQQHQIGLIVDGVEEVSTITTAEIEPPPQFGQEDSTESNIIGIAKIRNIVKTLLDINRIIGSDELHQVHRSIDQKTTEALN